MPDWEDKVDPHFDFQSDTFSPNRHVSQDVYAHEILTGPPPYTGILVSRAVVERSASADEALKQQGARSYFRLHDEMEVFGDCGAFSYVNERDPWYEVEDVLEYYNAIGVNYGASLDHLVVNSIYVTEMVEAEREDGTTETRPVKRKQEMDEIERRRRIELTLANAEKFIKLHRQRKYQYVPVGVAQGWTPDTYAESVKALVKMGYSYIALGGLARSPASQVRDVLVAANRVVEDSARTKREVMFHLFGVAKLTLLEDLLKHRVASIDSASYLRKAWLRSGQNYLGADGQWYTAIRVPQSDNPRVQEYISQNGHSPQEVQQSERHCLQMLQRHGEGGLPSKELDELLDIIVEYDTYLLRHGDDGQDMRNASISKERYRRTLEARPWEQCKCDICRQLGIQVLVFRGTNRNKRRGFHNTWTFHQRLKAVCSQG